MSNDRKAMVSFKLCESDMGEMFFFFFSVNDKVARSEELNRKVRVLPRGIEPMLLTGKTSFPTFRTLGLLHQY